MKRYCNGCKTERDTDYFHKGNTQCKSCACARSRAHKKKLTIFRQARRNFISVLKTKVFNADIKRCNKCDTFKLFSEYYKAKSHSDGLCSVCISCSKVSMQAYFSKSGNREKKAARDKAYYNQPEVKQRIFARYRERRRTDVEYKLIANHRSRRNQAIKLFFKNGEYEGSTTKELGCSVSFFEEYLEAQFEPGMTWDNWGPKGWHIDHIIPLSAGSHNPELFMLLCGYWNAQPLWAKDNLSKGERISIDDELLLDMIYR